MLTERALAPSRAKAQALIMAGCVYSETRRIDKAGEMLPADAPLAVRGQDHSYVSRGGVKLAGALEAFGFSPDGVVAADFGASTGGFTDCLLQRGATRVYAIDVGYGQLHDKLRSDPRVISLERTNARHLTPTSLAELVDLVVIDASFIGLEKLLPAAHHVLKPNGEVIALVKPQFEVGKSNLGSKGVVRNPAIRNDAIERVKTGATELGFDVLATADCVIHGPEGNLEAFLHLRRR